MVVRGGKGPVISWNHRSQPARRGFTRFKRSEGKRRKAKGKKRWQGKKQGERKKPNVPFRKKNFQKRIRTQEKHDNEKFLGHPRLKESPKN